MARFKPGLNKYQVRAEYGGRGKSFTAGRILSTKIVRRGVRTNRFHPNIVRGQSRPRNAFIQSQGFKRLGRLMAHQMRIVSNRKGFARRFLDMYEPDTSNQVFKPEYFKAPPDSPVPNHSVQFYDECMTLLSTLEDDMVFAMHDDIQKRMPNGFLANTGKYMTFDPLALDGPTGGIATMRGGVIIMVQRCEKLFEGEYAALQPSTKPAPKGWTMWEPTAHFEAVLSGVPKGVVIPAGTALSLKKDGTVAPLVEDSSMFAAIATLMGEQVRAEAEGEIIPEEPKRKGITLAQLRNLRPMYTVDGEATHVQINENTTLITDTYREPVIDDAPPASGSGWKLVEHLDLVIQPGPKPVVEGEEEVKTSETVNEEQHKHEE